MGLELVPCPLRRAKAYVGDWHRTHKKTGKGHMWSLAVALDGFVVGVAIVGRPVAHRLQDGFTCEVLRCCTDGTRNACSILYSAAARTARDKGYRRIITYTLAAEPGTSLVASGWTRMYRTKGGHWDRPSRPREPSENAGPKHMWCKTLRDVSGPISWPPPKVEPLQRALPFD